MCGFLLQVAGAIGAGIYVGTDRNGNAFVAVGIACLVTMAAAFLLIVQLAFIEFVQVILAIEVNTRPPAERE